MGAVGPTTLLLCTSISTYPFIRIYLSGLAMYEHRVAILKTKCFATPRIFWRKLLVISLLLRKKCMSRMHITELIAPRAFPHNFFRHFYPLMLF